MATMLQERLSVPSERQGDRQPWIYARWLDGWFILLPPFAALAIVFLFPDLFQIYQQQIPDTWWVVLILLIDVAHVYTTIYRTYFDPVTFRQHRTLFILVPVLALAGGVLAYSIDGGLFWRLLAYMAVFHFVRQQYGFLRIYSRREQRSGYGRWLDTACIYLSTIYPLLYWHFAGPRHFNWFVSGDFIYLRATGVLPVAKVCYLVVLGGYVVKEAWYSIRERQINLPKQLLVAGTALSWYFGIVYFNGDLAFTLLNVVSHGIPYMALVWVYGRKRYHNAGVQAPSLLRQVYGQYGIVLFLGIVVFLAYIEEGLWDGLVWREHAGIFSWASHLPEIGDERWLALAVPLLALPQLIHYILDGFIWKMRDGAGVLNE